MSNRKNKTNAKTFRVVVIMFLLCAYFIETLHIEPLLSSFTTHNEDHTLHSEEAEKDACHIKLYHKERKGGCEHDTHLSTRFKNSIQHVFCKAEHLEPRAYIYVPAETTILYANDIAVAAVIAFIAQLPSRAPPII